MKPTTPFHFLSIRDHLSTMVYCSSQTAQCVVEISVTLCSYRNVQCVTGTVLHCPAYNSYSVTLSTVQQLQISLSRSQQLQYHCPVHNSYSISPVTNSYSITVQCTTATVSLSSAQQLQYCTVQWTCTAVYTVPHCPVYKTTMYHDPVPGMHHTVLYTTASNCPAVTTSRKHSYHSALWILYCSYYITQSNN